MGDLINRLKRARGSDGGSAIYDDERAIDDAIKLLEASAWRPIEAAPKDGTEIIAWNAFFGSYQNKFKDGEWPRRDIDLEGIWYPMPTKWMPLPEPPKG